MERTFETPGAVRLTVKLGSGQIEVEPGLEGRTEVEVVPRNRGAREADIDAAGRELPREIGRDLGEQVEQPKVE